MLEDLKSAVCAANLDLVRRGLVKDTFGNVSGVDRASGKVVIKPSGVKYDAMQPGDMVVVELATGAPVEGKFKPSSDTATHCELYRAFPQLGAVAHTHSLFATAWAQARLDIPALGTTHADYFGGPVPCTRPMTADEIAQAYELNTGKVIVERFRNLDPLHVPAVLVASHGPFTWGASAAQAVNNADVLEYIARLARETLALSPGVRAMPGVLLQKHFFRKHGPGAYYGQQ